MAQNNQLTVIENLKSMLNVPSVMEQFKNSLGDNAGAFTASLVEMLSSNGDLKQCQPKDLIMEALKAASLRLPINKNIGQAWIIPRKEKGIMKPNFQIGYRGYIQLAIRTGQYRYLNADLVPANWEVTQDLLSGAVELKMGKESPNVADEPQGYFAYFELLNGFSKTLYYSREYLIYHMKKYVPSWQSKYSPWQNDFDKMAIKTVLSHLLSKYGYLSTEMVTAISQDYENSSPAEEADRNENSVDFSLIEEKEQSNNNQKEPLEKENELPAEFE